MYCYGQHQTLIYFPTRRSSALAGGASLTTSALKYGDKVTCTITNHRKARLEVVKKLDPAADNGTFNLQIDSATKKPDAGNNDTTGFLNVSNGVHSVGEVNGTSSPNTLADYDSEISCTDNTTNKIGRASCREREEVR